MVLVLFSDINFPNSLQTFEIVPKTPNNYHFTSIEFFTRILTGGFSMNSMSDSKCLQVSRILLNILSDFISAVV